MNYKDIILAKNPSKSLNFVVHNILYDNVIHNVVDAIHDHY